MNHAKKTYTTIIFDLTGVVFKVNKLDMCRRLGLFRTFWYVLTHRKNPVHLYLNALNALQKLPENKLDTPHSMRFGRLTFPSCITDYFIGKKTGRQTAHELHTGVQTLDAQNYFESSQERALLDHVISKVFIQEKSNGFVPIKKNVKIVQKLKGSYRLFLLSNFDKETFAQLYHRYRPIFDLFDGMVISGTVGLLKPYKEIYEHLLETYQIDPESAIFIDDQSENLREPQKMGIKTILYKKHKQMLGDLQKYVSVDL